MYSGIRVTGNAECQQVLAASPLRKERAINSLSVGQRLILSGIAFSCLQGFITRALLVHMLCVYIIAAWHVWISIEVSALF